MRRGPVLSQTISWRHLALVPGHLAGEDTSPPAGLEWRGVHRLTLIPAWPPRLARPAMAERELGAAGDRSAWRRWLRESCTRRGGIERSNISIRLRRCRDSRAALARTLSELRLAGTARSAGVFGAGRGAAGADLALLADSVPDGAGGRFAGGSGDDFRAWHRATGRNGWDCRCCCWTRRWTRGRIGTFSRGWRRARRRCLRQ